MEMEAAAKRLEEIGVIHAPEQTFEDGSVDGRYVTLRQRPGVYYITGADNVDRRPGKKPGDKIQLLFFGVPEMAEHFAEQICWSVESVEEIPVDDDSLRCVSAFLVASRS